MANIKSQIKRNKQNDKRAEKNKAVRTSLKTSTKKARTAVDSGDGEAATAQVLETSRALDKAASKGIVHKRTAARRKSRLAKAAKWKLGPELPDPANIYAHLKSLPSKDEVIGVKQAPALAAANARTLEATVVVRVTPFDPVLHLESAHARLVVPVARDSNVRLDLERPLEPAAVNHFGGVAPGTDAQHWSAAITTGYSSTENLRTHYPLDGKDLARRQTAV
jgi:small subunit ribosomal protein S20